MYDKEKELLPEFPRTQHLPLEPNAQSDDKVASEDEMAQFLSQNRISVQEKIDGASMGLTVIGGEPVVRNRSHILRKGYSARKTPAQQQFSRMWTWLYENMDKIAAIEKLLKTPVSVYGEWLFARHTIGYNQLPDWFVAYDVYDQINKRFLDPMLSLDVLKQAGFGTIHVIEEGSFRPNELLALRDGKSHFSDSIQREGIYLKSDDGQWCTGRYKMVAPWFKSSDEWNKQQMVKNTCLR